MRAENRFAFFLISLYPLELWLALNFRQPPVFHARAFLSSAYGRDPFQICV
jgi:hypothetical protein